MNRDCEPTIDGEWIVREVMRRLGAESTSSAERSAAHAKSPSRTQSTELQIPGRVITLSQLGDRLDGVRHLRVSRKAVITPAVHDLLRAQRIELIRDTPLPLRQDSRSAAPARHRLVVASDQSLSELTAAIQSTHCQTNLVEILPVQPLSRLVAPLCTRLAADTTCDTAGLLITQRPHAAACTANRNSAIRAAVAMHLEDLRQIHATWNANLFVTSAIPVDTIESFVQAIQKRNRTTQQ